MTNTVHIFIFDDNYFFEKFSDDEVDDEPEDNWFNDPDTQNTPDPDQRRNDVNHLRALNLFRNIATGTNENTWLANIGNTVNVASRRPYSRPTTSRLSRGTYRGLAIFNQIFFEVLMFLLCLYRSWTLPFTWFFIFLSSEFFKWCSSF